jgi:hypothetical protein
MAWASLPRRLPRPTPRTRLADVEGRCDPPSSGSWSDIAGPAVMLRPLAVVLTALEVRYLPVLDPEWLQLINADQDEWQRYRDGFDPVAASAQLGCRHAPARVNAKRCRPKPFPDCQTR